MTPSAALTEQNRLLGELLRSADPATPVPSCPGWTLRQLGTHVGRGDRWAATIVRTRADEPVDLRSVPDGKPPAGDATAWLHDGAAALLDAIDATGPDTPVWTFTGPQPAAWWIRRRLHEATVHRADAALALGLPYALAPDLAADGISEWLALLAARPTVPVAPLPDGVKLHLHATDTALTGPTPGTAGVADPTTTGAAPPTTTTGAAQPGAGGVAGEWLIHGDAGRVRWEHSHAKAAAAIRGTAVDLLLAVLGRPATVDVLGDPAVWTTYLERTSF